MNASNAGRAWAGGGAVRRMILLGIMLACLRRADGIAAVLPVAQKYQEKTQWCWAGCSQAILEYYGVAATQTAIAAYGTPRIDNTWNYLYGTDGSRRGIDMILDHFAGIDSTPYARCLSEPEVDSEISAGRPPVVRWGWDSGGGHFVVARGIDGGMIYLMDPWYGPTINAYSWVVSGGGHTWTHSLPLDTDPAPTAAPTITPAPAITPTPTPWIFPKRVNFQPPGSLCIDGFVPDWGGMYDEALTYGWI